MSLPSGKKESFGKEPNNKVLTAQRTGGSDKYQTPPKALTPLLKYIPKDWHIWEPTADQGLLLTFLRHNGRIATGTTSDFLTGDPPQYFDCILTNPPYSLKTKFLKRCYELGKPFALLMPLTALEGIERQALYKEHGIEILLLNRRINYIVPEGQHESGAWFASAWFCKGILPKTLNFGEVPNDPTPETLGALHGGL